MVGHYFSLGLLFYPIKNSSLTFYVLTNYGYGLVIELPKLTYENNSLLFSKNAGDINLCSGSKDQLCERLSYL